MITGNLTSDYLIFFNNLKILEMAALTLGIIGTALGALASNNGGCGCGNNGGILGGLFGGNKNYCNGSRTTS